MKHRFTDVKLKFVVTLFIHDRGYCDYMSFVIHGVKDNKITYWHLPKTTTVPWFFFILSVSFRHVIQF